MITLIWLVAVVICGLIALPIGAISLCTTGVYFIMVTVAFVRMIYYFAVSWPAYGGEDELSIYVRNEFPGVNTNQPLSYFLTYYAVLMTALGLFLDSVRFVLWSGLAGGLAERGRCCPPSALGCSIVRLVAFAISAMVMGLAGALITDLEKLANPSMLS